MRGSVRVRVRVRIRATPTRTPNPTPSPTPDLREGGYGAAVRGRALQQLDRLELGELDEAERCLGVGLGLGLGLG